MGGKAALERERAAKDRRKQGKRRKDKNRGSNGGRGKKQRRSLAERSDPYLLYQLAVQDPAADVDFMLRVWREFNGDRRDPRHFREDFCGTALLCAEWVTRGEHRTAEGVDLDPACLDWGREHNVLPLGAAADRLCLIEADVRSQPARPADVRCAQNFSYQIFHEREELAEYFRGVRDGLAEDGLFLLDMFGGTEAQEELEEERDIEEGDFTYVWEQRVFHPGTHHAECAIHFRFPDGSELRDAFSYHWRLYSPPEIRDLLYECGFSEVRTYFEEFDEDGDGTGHFAQDERGEACEGWLAYVVAKR